MTKNRTCRLIANIGVLWLKDAGQPEVGYWLTPMPSDFGRCFELKKFVACGPEIYQVCVDTSASRGKADACCCKGYLRWGKCKHVSALRALIALGKL